MNPQPISSLSIYLPSWCIKARVTKKSDLKKWDKTGSKGCLFSFDLVDDKDSEIRAVCFNACAEKNFDYIQEGSVYLVARGTIKPANKTYSTIKNNNEISLDDNSVIEKVEDDTSIPAIKFALTQLANLGDVADETIVDVIGVISTLSEIKEQMGKKSLKPYKMRTAQIVENSSNGKVGVEITFFGDIAERKDINVDSVVLCKGVKKTKYNGISLSALFTSSVVVNPDIIETSNLLSWYRKSGKEETTKHLSQKTEQNSSFTALPLSAIKDQNLGKSEKPDFINVNATISFIKKESIWYESCPNIETACKKKVSKK